MLTAGDVQFQPSSSKIWQLTNSICMMSAGDIGLQTEIFTQMQKAIAIAIKAAPTEWQRVEDMAELYRKAYFEIKRRRAEREILTPFGLDSDSFLSRQTAMHSDLVSKISMELIGYKMPKVAAIVAGNNPSIIDPTSVTAHIFVIENGNLSCSDKVGFACIGAGAWHANSTMMLAGHTPSTPIPKGLLAVYAAKKRAEVAPGVGTETDTFVVTAVLGGYSTLRDEIRDGVFKAHADLTKNMARANTKAEASLSDYIDEIIKPKEPPAEPQTTH
jgi:hypothetical protein